MSIVDRVRDEYSGSGQGYLEWVRSGITSRSGQALLHV